MAEEHMHDFASFSLLCGRKQGPQNKEKTADGTASVSFAHIKRSPYSTCKLSTMTLSARIWKEPPGAGFDCHYQLNYALCVVGWLTVWNLVGILWLTAVEHFQRELYIVPVYATLILVLQPVLCAVGSYSLLSDMLALAAALSGITASATYFGILLRRYTRDACSIGGSDRLCHSEATSIGFSWLIALALTAVVLWLLLVIILCKIIWTIRWKHWACCYRYYTDPSSWRFLARPPSAVATQHRNAH